MAASIGRQMMKLGGRSNLVAAQDALATQQRSASSLWPRNTVWMVTPPRNKIPLAEKVFWGVFMVTTILSVPVWVMWHADEYKGKERRSGWGKPKYLPKPEA